MKDRFFRQLAKVLVKQGILDEARAEEALQITEKDPQRTYCDVLLEGSYLKEEDYLSALALESRIPPIDLSKCACQAEALQVLNADIATHYGVLPLARLGKVLTLVLTNPFDLLKLDDLRALTNCEIRPFVATDRAIRNAVKKEYASMEGGEKASAKEDPRRLRKGEPSLETMSTKALAGLLTWDDREVVKKALTHLVERRALEEIPAIATLLTHAMGVLRLQAAEALFRLDASDAYDTMVAGLQDADASIRLEILRFLLRARDARRFERVRAAIRHRDASLRREILQSLEEYDGPDRPELLGEFLEDPDFFLRKKAFDSLSSLPPQQAYLVFRKVVSDTNSVLRKQAVEALLRYPDEQSVPGLIPALGESDALLRKTIWDRIERAATEDLLRQIEEALDSVPEPVLEEHWDLILKWSSRKNDESLWESAAGTEKVRSRAALELLSRKSLSDIESWVRKCYDGGDRSQIVTVLRGLARMEKVECRELVRFGLRHPMAAVRETALRECLRGVRLEQFDEELLRLSGDPESSVRAVAVNGVLGRKSPGWEKIAAEGVRDPFVEIRKASVNTLVVTSDDWVVAPLEIAAGDEDAAVSTLAVKCLVKRGIGKQELAPHFARTFAAGGDDPIRSKIAEMLGTLKVQTSLPDLVAAAKKGGPLLRRSSAQAIAAIGGKEGLDSLAALSATDDVNVLRIVATKLGEASDDRAVIPLIRASEECKGRSAKAAEKMLKKYAYVEEPEFLISSLKIKRASVKRFAAGRLEHCTDRRALGPLQEAMSEPNGDVQMAVLKALGNFTEEPSIVEKIMEYVTFGETAVRQTAVEVLGDRKVLSSVPVLIRVLGNVFLKVRAMEALKKIGDRKGILAILRRKRREEEIEKQKERIRDLNEKRNPNAASGDGRPRKKKKAVIKDA